MKITVVTPTFNQAPYLERALRSIHEQKGDFELEHLVFDAGSTDGTVEILEQWKDRLDFVSEPDRGQSHALNKGFAKATGDVLAWLNSDDLYMPGALEAAVRFFRQRPEVRWAYGRCIIIDEHDREIRRSITWYKHVLLRRFSFNKLLIENYISQPATFFSRSLLNEVGEIDEDLHFAMDYDLWLRFARIAPAGVIDAEMAAIRLHADCKTGSDFHSSLQEANRVSRKHADAAGFPLAGKINYWTYYKRTALIYRLITRGKNLF